MERKRHTEEFKIRLRAQDGALLRALAERLDIAPAVLVRRWAVREIQRAAERRMEERTERRIAS